MSVFRWKNRINIMVPMNVLPGACTPPTTEANCSSCRSRVCHSLKDECVDNDVISNDDESITCCECGSELVYDGEKCVEPLACQCVDEEGKSFCGLTLQCFLIY